MDLPADKFDHSVKNRKPGWSEDSPGQCMQPNTLAARAGMCIALQVSCTLEAGSTILWQQHRMHVTEYRHHNSLSCKLSAHTAQTDTTLGGQNTLLEP